MRTAVLFLVASVVTAAVLFFVHDANAQLRERLRPSVVPAQPVMQAQPQVQQGPIRDFLRERILLRAIRNGAIEKAVKDGVDGKKVTKAEAEAAYERMIADIGTDGVMRVAAEAAPSVQGQLVGGRLSDFFDWVLKNAPAIIELLMKILPLFL